MPQVSGGHLRGFPDCGDVTVWCFMFTRARAAQVCRSFSETGEPGIQGGTRTVRSARIRHRLFSSVQNHSSWGVFERGRPRHLMPIHVTIAKKDVSHSILIEFQSSLTPTPRSQFSKDTNVSLTSIP